MGIGTTKNVHYWRTILDARARVALSDQLGRGGLIVRSSGR